MEKICTSRHSFRWDRQNNPIYYIIEIIHSGRPGAEGIYGEKCKGPEADVKVLGDLRTVLSI